MEMANSNSKFDGFFDNFFKNFSIEKINEEETAIKEAEIPREKEPEELEFSAENITFPDIVHEEKEVEEIAEQKEPVPQIQEQSEETETKDFKSMNDAEVKQDVDSVIPTKDSMTIPELEEMDLDVLESNQGFSITNDKVADWALEKIHAEYDEFTRIKELTNGRIADYKERLAKEEKRYKNATKYLKSCLEAYFLSVPIKKSAKTQESYKLLHGNLVMKKATTEYETDEQVLLAYLKKNDLTQFIRVKETVDWESLKKHIENDSSNVVLKETGECIAGISIKKKPTKFDIKFFD